MYIQVVGVSCNWNYRAALNEKVTSRHMRIQRTITACSQFARKFQNHSLMQNACIKGGQTLWWDYAHAQNTLNLRISHKRVFFWCCRQLTFFISEADIRIHYGRATQATEVFICKQLRPWPACIYKSGQALFILTSIPHLPFVFGQVCANSAGPDQTPHATQRPIRVCTVWYF